MIIHVYFFPHSTHEEHGSVLGQHETAPHACTEPEQPSKACTAPAQEPVPHPIVKHRGTLSSSVGTKPPSISAPLIVTTTWYPDPIYKPIKTIAVEAARDSCPIKQRVMEPQPVLELELEPESEQVPEPVPQPESEPVTEVEPEPEPEPIPMLDPIPFDPVQQKPEYEPEPPVEPGLELEPVPELETKPPVPDLEPGLEPEPVPELETKPPVPDLEPGLEQEPVPELETGPESELELEADPESELELVDGELCNLSRELHLLPDPTSFIALSNCSFIVEEEPQEPVTHSEVEALPALQHNIERESEPKQEHPPGRSPSYSYVIDNGYRHPKSESGSDPELKSESEPQSGLSQRPYETSFAGELDPAENPVPEVEPAEPEVNAEQGFKSQSESKPGAESKQESESKPEPQSKPEAELGSKPGSKSESESRSICETKPVPVSEPVLTSEPVKADSPPLSRSHKGREKLQQAASLKDEKSDTATAAAGKSLRY